MPLEINKSDMEINSSEGENELLRIANDMKRHFQITVDFNSERPMIQKHTIICCSQVNEAAYSPTRVLIGPLISASRERCQSMIRIEMQKRIYLDSFLQKAKPELNDFLELIGNSRDLQGCYERTFRRFWDFPDYFQQEHLCEPSVDVEMILVDASFIIELFLRDYDRKWREVDDFIFDEPLKFHDIRRDLLLAENQLPFFILKEIYQHAFSGNPEFPSFLQLTYQFFSPYYYKDTYIEDIISPRSSHDETRAKLEEVKHFTDLLRTLQLPYLCRTQKPLRSKLPLIRGIKTMVRYFVRLIISSLPLISSKKTEDTLEAGHVQSEYLYSAVLLREAGVKFKVHRTRCFTDIKFNKNNGEFKIPALILDKWTESIFKNLMAWERYYYPHETHICDYIFLMEYLVKSSEDVDLLVRKRILVNQLGSHTAVVTLFNNLCKDITTPPELNHYFDIFGKLNAYNAVRHHSWIAILKLQYFSTLWKGVATIAAVILLVLTLIQTICAVITLVE